MAKGSPNNKLSKNILLLLVLGSVFYGGNFLIARQSPDNLTTQSKESNSLPGEDTLGEKDTKFLLESCQAQLKDLSWVRSAWVKSDPERLEVNLNWDYFLENAPSEVTNVDWGEKGISAWNWYLPLASQEIRQICKGEIKVEIRFLYVKRSFNELILVD